MLSAIFTRSPTWNGRISLEVSVSITVIVSGRARGILQEQLHNGLRSAA